MEGTLIRERFTGLSCKVHMTQRSQHRKTNIDEVTNGISIAFGKTSEANKGIQKHSQANNAAALLIDDVKVEEPILYGTKNLQHLSCNLHGYDSAMLDGGSGFQLGSQKRNRF